MTAIGSCIEFWEEGQIWRGNNRYWIISSQRPNSMEAPYWKNPVYHSWAVYTYFAWVISKKLFEKFWVPNTTMIKSDNGVPLLNPSHVFIEVPEQSELDEKSIIEEIEAIFQNNDHVSDLVGNKILMPHVW